MPYADREVKLAHMREWRKTKIAQGYGRWLYARRKLRFEDAKRFRAALEAIADVPVGREGAVLIMRDIATAAIAEADRAEEALGDFREE